MNLGLGPGETLVCLATSEHISSGTHTPTIVIFFGGSLDMLVTGALLAEVDYNMLISFDEKVRVSAAGVPHDIVRANYRDMISAHPDIGKTHSFLQDVQHERVLINFVPPKIINWMLIAEMQRDFGDFFQCINRWKTSRERVDSLLEQHTVDTARNLHPRN